jgi:LysR family hydrogen peroxide-inducible transcriptional activator
MRRLLPLFRDEFPEVKLHLREEKTAALLERLAEAQLDAAIVSAHLERPGFTEIALFREELQLAVPQGAPLAARKQVTPKDIEALPYIELEEGHCLREDSVVQCRLNRHGLRHSVQATSLESARQMVMAGIGATIVPALAVGAGMDDEGLVRYLPFARPTPQRTLSLLFRKRAANAAHLEALALRMRAFLAAAKVKGISAPEDK